MRKNAFTLIELLAVIVILAIIALIATPIILGIINDSKEESKKRSAENYIGAVEQAIVRENLQGKYNPDECMIEKGEVTCEGEFDPSFCEVENGELNCNGITLDVDIDGEVPEEGTIVFLNSKVTNGTNFTIGGTTYIMLNKELKEVLPEGPEHLKPKNVRATTSSTKTTGSVPGQDENGNIIVGSEFKIKVNDTSGWLTFFVLSNSDDGKYVNLIAEQNITKDGIFTSELQTIVEWYVTSLKTADNRYGPQTAYDYLSTATSNWSNIPIIVNFTYEDEGYVADTSGYQSVITTKEEMGIYITKIKTLSGETKSYENMRARLPKYSEVALKIGATPLWMVNYLAESSNYTTDDGKVNSKGSNNGYWTLSSHKNSSTSAYGKNWQGTVSTVGTYYIYFGVRPVITVLKSDLLRVM